MKHQAAIALVVTLSSLVVAPAPASADGPAAIATIPSSPKPRTPTVLTMKNASTVPGEKKVYEAVLKTSRGAPVANKKVTLRIEGKNGLAVSPDLGGGARGT